ncbi:hypothetical protein HDU96_008094 [Phlyctochytrium bullatum]|nr:hypothetical protein HDU96_008094 [Phlyctochytrium bullatum]
MFNHTPQAPPGNGVFNPSVQVDTMDVIMQCVELSNVVRVEQCTSMHLREDVLRQHHEIAALRHIIEAHNIPKEAIPARSVLSPHAPAPLQQPWRAPVAAIMPPPPAVEEAPIQQQGSPVSLKRTAAISPPLSETGAQEAAGDAIAIRGDADMDESPDHEHDVNDSPMNEANQDVDHINIIPQDVRQTPPEADAVEDRGGYAATNLIPWTAALNALYPGQFSHLTRRQMEHVGSEVFEFLALKVGRDNALNCVVGTSGGGTQDKPTYALAIPSDLLDDFSAWISPKLKLVETEVLDPRRRKYRRNPPAASLEHPDVPPPSAQPIPPRNTRSASPVDPARAGPSSKRSPSRERSRNSLIRIPDHVLPLIDNDNSMAWTDVVRAAYPLGKVLPPMSRWVGKFCRLRKIKATRVPSSTSRAAFNIPREFRREFLELFLEAFFFDYCKWRFYPVRSPKPDGSNASDHEKSGSSSEGDDDDDDDDGHDNGVERGRAMTSGDPRPITSNSDQIAHSQAHAQAPPAEVHPQIPHGHAHAQAPPVQAIEPVPSVPQPQAHAQVTPSIPAFAQAAPQTVFLPDIIPNTNIDATPDFQPDLALLNPTHVVYEFSTEQLFGAIAKGRAFLKDVGRDGRVKQVYFVHWLELVKYLLPYYIEESNRNARLKLKVRSAIRSFVAAHCRKAGAEFKDCICTAPNEGRSKKVYAIPLPLGKEFQRWFVEQARTGFPDGALGARNDNGLAMEVEGDPAAVQDVDHDPPARQDVDLRTSHTLAAEAKQRRNQLARKQEQQQQEKIQRHRYELSTARNQAEQDEMMFRHARENALIVEQFQRERANLEASIAVAAAPAPSAGPFHPVGNAIAFMEPGPSYQHHAPQQFVSNFAAHGASHAGPSQPVAHAYASRNDQLHAPAPQQPERPQLPVLPIAVTRPLHSRVAELRMEVESRRGSDVPPENSAAPIADAPAMSISNALAAPEIAQDQDEDPEDEDPGPGGADEVPGAPPTSRPPTFYVNRNGLTLLSFSVFRLMMRDYHMLSAEVRRAAKRGVIDFLQYCCNRDLSACMIPWPNQSGRPAIGIPERLIDAFLAWAYEELRRCFPDSEVLPPEVLVIEFPANGVDDPSAPQIETLPAMPPSNSPDGQQ